MKEGSMEEVRRESAEAKIGSRCQQRSLQVVVDIREDRFV